MMAKFVVSFVIGDGCSWSQDIVIPTEADSKDDILLNYIMAVEEAVKDRGSVKFLSGNDLYDVYGWDLDTFFDSDTKIIMEDAITIETLDKWFESNKK